MKTYIAAKDYMAWWPTVKRTQTDDYYIRLANRLCEAVSTLHSDVLTPRVLAEVARRLTCYFEDVVADMGLWRTFSAICREKYGYPVPLYHDEEEYYDDEPSFNAVSYLVWQTVSDAHPDRYIFTASPDIVRLSKVVYEVLDGAFEDAPVNDTCKADVKTLIENAGKSFDHLREALTWFDAANYLTTNPTYMQDVEENLSHYEDMDIESFTPDMRLYLVHTQFLFSYKTGPLALRAPEWLSALAGTLGLQQVKALVDGMEVLRYDTYKYAFTKDDKWLNMENLHGKKIEVRVEEMNWKLEMLKQHDGCMAQFIFFNGEWHLNGVMMPLQLEGKFESLKEDTPDIPKKGQGLLTADMILKRTNGRRIFYFKDVYDLTDTMKRLQLIPAKSETLFPDDEKHQFPLLFIDTEEPVDNMFIGFHSERDICDSANPYYDADYAKNDALSFMHDTNVSSHLVDWLIDQGFLPDVANYPVFHPGSTPEQLRGDMHFLLRTERRNEY